jgi:flavin reductase (DIM6/NTAB) family NADH-FMN oxidoreductase RutF
MNQIENADSFLGIDPSELLVSDVNRLLLHCVSPRPIAFTSTVSPDGIPNLAPFSYFTLGGANPPSIVISPLTGKAGEPKDTLRNIEMTGEFVINVVTYGMREKMNLSSLKYPFGVSEWQDAGFTPVTSDKVAPPRILESPLGMECRLYKIVKHGMGPLSANYVIGEVIYFHISRSIMPDGVIDPSKIDYLARLGGDWYARMDHNSIFEMPLRKRDE